MQSVRIAAHKAYLQEQLWRSLECSKEMEMGHELSPSRFLVQSNRNGETLMKVTGRQAYLGAARGQLMDYETHTHSNPVHYTDTARVVHCRLKQQPLRSAVLTD